VERVFGFHVIPEFPVGAIVGRPGPFFAGVDMFEITVLGKGGHAAMPMQTIDPIPAAAAIVQGIHSMVSRETAFTMEEAGLVSVTSVQGGNSFNAIPSSVVLRGTIRSYSTKGLPRLSARVEEIARTIASSYRCNITHTAMDEKIVPTINDKDVWSFVEREAAIATTKGKVDVIEPTMAGEDFGFYALKVPSSFILLGSSSGSPETRLSLHNDKFTLDERVLRLGAALHPHLAFRALEELQSQRTGSPSADEL